jgi:hypothetical protein
MSYTAEAMREACLDPMFTVDEQVIRVTNCQANGGTVMPGGVEPEVVPIAQSIPPQKGTVDAEAVSPGEADPKTDPPPPAPVEGNGVMDWVKKNPGIVAVGAAALLLIFGNRRSR